MNRWQIIEADSLQAAQDTIVAAFETIQADAFNDPLLGGWGLNPKLTVEVRGLKRIDTWLTGFVLTPWMLAQLYIPLQAPEWPLDPAWMPEARTSEPYVVIGPQQQIEFGGQRVQAFLNFHPQLGHYYLQPLVQSMAQYCNNAAAFEAWAEVIRFRQETYARILAEQEEREKKALQQTENHAKAVSRRDFLRRWRS